MKKVKIKPFKYLSGKTPQGYSCSFCKAKGVRLYRLWNTFLDYQELSCRKCTIKRNPSKNDEYGDIMFPKTEHQLRGLCAAVPTEEGDTFWGYTSVPDDGVKWWDNLPKSLRKKAKQ